MGNDRRRLAVGLVVAPLIVVPLTFVGYAALNLLQVDGFRGDMPAAWPAAGNFALAALVAAYVLQAAVGAPVSVFLQLRARFSLARMLVLGGVCGALPFVVAQLMAPGGRRDASTLYFAGIGTGFGAAIAATTYGLARGRTGSP